MALSSAIEWDVRASANDANGGGFKSGATGTDRSLSTTPHVTFDGATITAANGGISDTITLSGYTVINGDVGNILNITAGTNFTTGRYEIIAVNTGAGTWQLDRNCTTGAGSAMEGRMGGSLLTSAPALASGGALVDGNTIWFKNGLSAITATISVVIQGTNALGIKVRGYGTTHGDGTPCALTCATNSVAFFTLNNADFYFFRDFTLTHSAATRGPGFVNVTAASQPVRFQNVNCDGCSIGFDGGTSTATTIGIHAIDCDAINSTSHGFRLRTDSHLEACVSRSNTGDGINIPNNVSATYNLTKCLSYDNSANGVQLVASGSAVVFKMIHCTLAFNGVDGLEIGANTSTYTVAIEGNIVYGNTTESIDVNDTQAEMDAVKVFFDYNFYDDAPTGITAGPNDVTLSADPFTDSGGLDFTLNNTAGGGADCRNATLGNFDAGALQHADSGSSGGFVVGG